MPDSQLKLYPRGFIGAVLAPRVIKKHTQAETNQGFRTQDVAVLANQNRFDTPNPVVEELYNTYLLDSQSAKSFDFRQRVLQAALTAFGHLNFQLWFQTQYDNTSAGELHGRFLVDTLKFLDRGRREMSLETWAAIITIDSGSDTIGPLPKEARDFFGIAQSWKRESDYPSIIQLWCSQPGGLEDLLGTLHILFGAPAAH